MTTPDQPLHDTEAEAPVGSDWHEPARTLALTLGLADNVRTCGASDAVVVAGGERAWVVLSGSFDLFLVTDETGTRRHLLRVPSGGIALEIALESDIGNFLLVPSNGARIVETTVSALMAGRQTSPAYDDALADAITEWVGDVAEIAASPDRPATLRTLDPDGAAVIEQLSTLRAGVVWLPADAVRHSMWGDGVPAETSAVHHVPLSYNLWAGPLSAEGAEESAQEEGEESGEKSAEEGVHTLTVAEWLDTADVLDDLAGYHARAVVILVEKLAQERSDERQRITNVRSLRRNEVETAISELASVMISEEQEDTGHRVVHLDLATAAAAVWHAMGIDRPLSDSALRRIQAAPDPVGTLAREARLFVRMVDISDPTWWRAEHGPLLAFRGPEMVPCALVPSKRRNRYDLVDPTTHQRVPVNAALAEEIAPDAFSFNDPLPAGELDPKTILRFAMRGVQRDGRAIGFMAFLAGILSLVVPVVTSQVMDPVIPDALLNMLWVLVGAMVVSGFSTVAFSVVQGMAAVRMEGVMANRMQSAVWDRLLRLPASFFRGYSVGNLASRAQSIDQIRSLLTGTVVTGLLHSISGLFSLGYMLFVSWRLAMVSVAAAVIYGTIAILIGRAVLARNRELYRLTNRIQGVVLQLLNAVAKLRIAGAEGGAYARWADGYSHIMAVSYEQRRLNVLLAVFKHMFLFLATGAVIVTIGLQGGELLAFFETPRTWTQIDATVLHTILPTASFVAFNVAFGQFFAAVFGISQQLVHLTNLKPLYDQVTPILDAKTEEDDGVEDPGEITGTIEMTDIRFRYAPEAPLILNGLSLHIDPGRFVAIVGPSGAGKSTLVRLLLGFDRPESGSVFYDGKDLARLDKTLLRRQMGVVLQNGRTLAASLFDNIAAGANVSRDDVMEAARLAGLDKDIERLPMGLDTYVGEGAATLSGGQRQRLMIARAVVRKPKVLIFDEATSALDNETQALVSRGLEGLDATRIVIAHRLSTIINADQILVLSGGKLAEKGTYEELMELDGIFAQLAKRQLA